MRNTGFAVRFSHKVDIRLEVFLKFMWDNCIYRDSGLYHEDVIVENFIQDMKLLVREIRSWIENTISRWVFWEIQCITEDFEETKLVIFVRSYNITCHCRKWQEDRIVTVEDIFIRT